MHFGSITSQRPMRPRKLRHCGVRSEALRGSLSPWKASNPPAANHEGKSQEPSPALLHQPQSDQDACFPCDMVCLSGKGSRAESAPSSPQTPQARGIPRPSTSITTLPHTLPDSAILRHDFMHHWLLHFPNWPISFLALTI